MNRPENGPITDRAIGAQSCENEVGWRRVHPELAVLCEGWKCLLLAQRSRASWRPGRPLTGEKPPLPSVAIFLSRPGLAICFRCHNSHSGK